jgi:ADP-L-glycero-D-manno-heptose 6-epimerase
MKTLLAVGYTASVNLRGKDTDIWRDRRVLVTGGAGFIGSALVWGLNQRACTDIVIADHAGRAERETILKWLSFADYVPALSLLEKLKAGALGKFDCVLHMGACSSTTETDAEYLRRNNFEFSRDLAAWALHEGVRFVYASSAATYGSQPGGDDRDLRSIEHLQPLNLYGKSKQEMDLYALREGWLDRIVGLKYFNVFGPNENHKGDMRSMVNKSFEQVRGGGTLQLFKSYRPEYGDGEQKRDFLYVKDAVAMTLYLAVTSSANGIFNIGSGEAHSWNEVAAALFAALGMPPRIEYIEMPETIRGQYQYFTQADIRKLRAAGYDCPITPLNEAVRDYVVSYLVPGESLGQP